MKAIKLASIFAVTAVAAAVSTTTMAADAVFSGSAGIEYVNYKNDSNNDSVDGSDLGEVEFVVDTGVVYAEVELAGSDANAEGDDDETIDLGLEKLYVTQGAVSFGRFDGTVSTGSFMGLDELQSGVDLTTSGDTDSAGLRYQVTPELTVALEATASTSDEASEVGFAASYVQDFGAFKAGISGGAVGDANAINVGVQSVAGPATVSLNYGSGVSGTTGDTDVELMTASVAVAATEAFSLTLELSSDLEAETNGTYFVAEYVVGDLTYYAKNYAGELVGDDDERTILGVTASF